MVGCCNRVDRKWGQVGVPSVCGLTADQLAEPDEVISEVLVVVDHLTALKRMVLTTGNARFVIGLVDVPLDSHDTATVVAPQLQVIIFLRTFNGVDSQAHSIK